MGHLMNYYVNNKENADQPVKLNQKEEMDHERMFSKKYSLYVIRKKTGKDFR